MCSRRLSLFTLDWGDLEGGGGDEAEHHREGTRQVEILGDGGFPIKMTASIW